MASSFWRPEHTLVIELSPLQRGVILMVNES